MTYLICISKCGRIDQSVCPQKRSVTGDTYLIAKRIMDIMLVLVSAPVWLPLLGVVALAILVTSPGEAVLFKQCRTGKGGNRFNMYKFRTMVPNAEQLKSSMPT